MDRTIIIAAFLCAGWACSTAGGISQASTPQSPLVVLDPGHGGSASGMVAPGGLRESDVNLAVALSVREKLRAAGVRVVMTRVADTDARPATPFVLREDLIARARLAGALLADLFVSCHHNATGTKGDEGWALAHNRTEVYYRVLDEGASREAGLSLLAALAPLVEDGHPPKGHARRRSKALLLPGGFAVLRENQRPAVLGEPLYLSASTTEGYARDPRFAELEARFYARGITDYLAHAPSEPRIVRPAPGETIDRTPMDLVVDHQGSAGSTVIVTLGPREWRFPASPDRRPGLTVPARPLPGSIVTRVDLDGVPSGDAMLFARLMEADGRASPVAGVPVVISLPTGSLDVVTFPDPPARGLPAVIRVMLHDGRGLPVADGTTIRLTVGTSAPRETITTAGSSSVLIDRVDGPIVVSAGAQHVRVVPASPAAQVRWSIERVVNGRSGRAIDDGLRVEACPQDSGAPGNDYVACATAREGEVLVLGHAACARILVNANGYTRNQTRTIQMGTSLPAEEIRLTPVMDGALIGRQVVLDVPTPSLRATLPRLAAALDRAGAHTRTTVTAGDPATEDEGLRVRNTNDEAFDVGVALLGTRLAGPVSIRHHPASAPGAAIARAIARALARSVPGLAAHAMADGSYWLNNTRGTTLEVVMGGRGAALDPATLAQAITEGLAVGIATGPSSAPPTSPSPPAIPSRVASVARRSEHHRQ